MHTPTINSFDNKFIEQTIPFKETLNSFPGFSVQETRPRDSGAAVAGTSAP